MIIQDAEEAKGGTQKLRIKFLFKHCYLETKNNE